MHCSNLVICKQIGCLIYVIIFFYLQQFIQMNEGKSKYELVLLAKLAQQTERYQQMASYANRLFCLQQELGNAERNLCASAYKNLVNNRRAQLKVLNAIQQKLSNKQSKQMFSALKSYRKTIQDELIKICKDIIKIMEEQIQTKNKLKSIEGLIFSSKLIADFYRYLCQIDDDDGTYFDAALHYYTDADKKARANLPPTHQIRLSLHLNMSVFLYQRANQPQKALQLANRAFDEAVANVNQTNQQSFKNCTMILQLLRDNINLWSQQVDV